jgi:hypothetical protein
MALIVYSRHLIPRRGRLFPGLTDANRISEHRIKSMESGVSRLGQPRQLNGPFAWRGSSIKQQSGWNFTLDEIDLACLNTALDNAVSAQMEWLSLNRTRFPLPGLSGKTRCHPYRTRRGWRYGLDTRNFPQSLYWSGSAFIVVRPVPVPRRSRLPGF